MVMISTKDIIAFACSAIYITAAVAMVVSVIPFKVAVVHNERVCLGRVSTRDCFWWSPIYIRIVQPVVMNDRVTKVTRAEYGITWCYGWEGRAADALRAYRGLTT
jgi:hypothetical protein